MTQCTNVFLLAHRVDRNYYAHIWIIMSMADMHYQRVTSSLYNMHNYNSWTPINLQANV